LCEEPVPDAGPPDAGPCSGLCTHGQTCLNNTCLDAVAWYPFEEGQGTSTTDATGNGHTGTLDQGASFATGHTTGGLYLDSSSPSFQGFEGDGFTSLGVVNQAFSFEAWIQPTTSSGMLLMVASNQQANTFWCFPFLGFDSSGHLVGQTLVTVINNVGYYLIATDPNPLPSGVWTHVAMTWSPNDGVRLYRNGVDVADAPPVQSYDHDFPASNVSDYIILGSLRGSANYCWFANIEIAPYEGAVDDFKVFDRELQPSEVSLEASP
jgi:hypothetical protein